MAKTNTCTCVLCAMAAALSNNLTRAGTPVDFDQAHTALVPVVNRFIPEEAAHIIHNAHTAALDAAGIPSADPEAIRDAIRGDGNSGTIPAEVAAKLAQALGLNIKPQGSDEANVQALAQALGEKLGASEVKVIRIDPDSDKSIEDQLSEVIGVDDLGQDLIDTIKSDLTSIREGTTETVKTPEVLIPQLRAAAQKAALDPNNAPDIDIIPGKDYTSALESAVKFAGAIGMARALLANGRTDDGDAVVTRVLAQADYILRQVERLHNAGIPGALQAGQALADAAQGLADDHRNTGFSRAVYIETMQTLQIRVLELAVKVRNGELTKDEARPEINQIEIQALNAIGNWFESNLPTAANFVDEDLKGFAIRLLQTAQALEGRLSAQGLAQEEIAATHVHAKAWSEA